MTTIDTHVHYIDEDPIDYIDTLLRRMDENGVDKSVLFGVQGDPMCSDGAVWHAVNRHPDRFIPFACSVRCDLKRDAEVFLNYVCREPWRGVGEVYLDVTGERVDEVTGEHVALFVKRNGEQACYPYYCPAGKHRNAVYARVFTECGRLGLTVMVHCRSREVMAETLSMFPQTKFIWAHADHGYWSCEPVPMLDQYPNLYCDIGTLFRFEAEKLLSEKLEPDDQWLRGHLQTWQAAASCHPPRIMWGTDIFVWPDLDPAAYRRSREVFNLFCEPLPYDAKAGIAGGTLLSLLPR